VALRSNASQGLFIFEASRSHSKHITVDRAPLDERSARRRDFYLKNTTLTININASGGIQTHSLSRPATSDSQCHILLS